MLGRIYMKYAIILVLLALAGCSGGQTQYVASAYTSTVATSCTNLSTTNSYSGSFSNTDVGITGSLKLSIINSTTATTSVVRNFTAVGLLVLNGNQYCCTTTGATGSLTTDPAALVLNSGGPYSSAITSLALGCTAVGGTGYGSYGGGYYNNAIQIVMPALATMYPQLQQAFPYVFITTGNHLVGFMTINSNVSTGMPSFNNIGVFIN
jgi:hypothetical protein